MQTKQDITRGALVGLNGAGAIYVNPDGTSAVIGAVDSWFKSPNIQKDAFKVTERRLSKLLGVQNFYMPPVYKAKMGNGQGNINIDLTIPASRFPYVHFCTKCGLLHELNPGTTDNRDFCKNCNESRRFMQLPFVMLCQAGHMSDLPYQELVHGLNPPKSHQVILKRKGSSVTEWKLECLDCEKTQSLRGLTGQSDDGKSGLSNEMLKKTGEVLACPGARPWVGNAEHEQCLETPALLLKNSVNVYNPLLRSSLTIPGNDEMTEDELSLVKSLEAEEARDMYDMYIDSPNEKKLEMLERQVKRYGFEGQLTAEKVAKVGKFLEESNDEEEEYTYDDILSEEFEQLSQSVESDSLVVRPTSYSNPDSVIEMVNLVPRLTETIVQTGFTRMASGMSMAASNNAAKLKEYEMMFDSFDDYLPAKKVYGEGIFVKFNSEILEKWASNDQLVKYWSKYIARKPLGIDWNFDTAKKEFVHTFSHLMINQLADLSGYTTVSISERIYADESKDEYGVLIYTSAGDIEGTFGGLVRLGKPEVFINEVIKALELGEWCSSDPVCFELGSTSGQGINGVNGAACHNCLYLPETSCGYMNSGLDRILLYGTHDSDFGIQKYLA